MRRIQPVMILAAAMLLAGGATLGQPTCNPSNDADCDGVKNPHDVCWGDDASGNDDGDGYCNDVDVCTGDDDAGDSDGDRVCDDLDVCFGDDASGDSDGDAVCDDVDPCYGDNASGDTDGDGICGDLDACTGNDATGDTDLDGICDDLDLCNGDDATGDSDADGICDDLDLCTGTDATGDTDLDGVCDDLDLCEGDDATGDSDTDGTCDGQDPCPFDPGDDTDADGLCADADNCSAVFNPPQDDEDGDGRGDCCDPYVNCGSLVAIPILPSPDYTDTSQLPTAQGQSYLDQAFSGIGGACQITRLTDALNDSISGTTIHHEYSSMSPFNADNSRVLLRTAATNPLDSFFVIDLQGNVVADPSVLQVSSGGEPRWSPTDPDLLYYHTVNSGAPNALMSYNVSTGTRTPVRSFPLSIDFGRGESDISSDGNHLVIHVGTTGNVIHRYQISNDNLGPALSGGSIDDASRDWDWCDLTPATNNILCRFDTSVGVCVGGSNDGSPCTASSQCPDGTCYFGYHGIELFDGGTGAFLRQVTSWTGHADRGIDEDGSEILVMVDSGGGGCAPGIAKVDIWTSETTCLLSYQGVVPPQQPGGSWTSWWNKGNHVSINNGVDGHPFALISNYDAKTYPDTRDFNSTLPTNWQDIWGTYFNELILVALDGSKAFRLVHHRSRDGGYWSTPRAALSRDGRYALFDSNYALNEAVPAYADIYQVRTTWDGSLHPDGDGDGLADPCDNCPADSNPLQQDNDADGWGNVCDNCPDSENPGQNYVGDPVVAVTAPNGGEVLSIASATNLQWTASDACGGVSTVDLLLSRSGAGGPFETIAAGLPNIGVHSWTVTGPGTVGFTAFLKVVARDPAGNEGEDLSDAGFRIDAGECGPCSPTSYCTGNEMRCTHHGGCGAGGCCQYTCVPDPGCQVPDPCPLNACGCL